MQNEKRQNIFFVITMILMSIYLVWRTFFTLPWGEGVLNVIFGMLLIVAETVTVLTTFELFFQKMQKERTQLDFPIVPPEYYPDVDVFIATHNEPVDLLYKTVNACTFMDYPDKQKVHIYLCDDGARPEVEELAKQFGVGYLGFPGNKDAKSGNLNNALSKSSSPLIATFDADMIPQHTFLMKTVPYFMLSTFIKENEVWRPRREDEMDPKFKLGLVQTPQSFYNPDLFQFNLYAEQGIPNEQDFFSREVNILRNASNAVAYTGSNTIISRQGMEDIGGFPLNTITEDFETSIRLQQEGYITYATQEVQAAGQTTTTVKSMIKQRIRWARGIIQSLQNTRAPLSGKLPFWTRVTYLSSFLYWWSFFNRLIFILAPILFALFDFQIVNTTFWQILIFWLPSYFFYSVSMRYLSSNIRNQRWSQVIDTIFMPYLIWPVLLETLGIREKKFKVTNKSRASGRQWMSALLYALPHIFLLLLSIAAVIRYVNGKYGIALFFSSIIIFWLIHNMIALCYALFFMIGRRAYRETERIRAQEDVTIHDQANNLRYQAKTVDVSEQGIAFYVPYPIYLAEQKIISLVVKTDRYEANLDAVIVYVKQDGEGWRYSATVQPIDENDNRQYMQIIYDRKHSLPEQMNLWDTAYDDMLRNVKKRIVQPRSDQRKMPRLSLQLPVHFTNDASCTLRSFNYRFFSATGFHGDIAAGAVVTFYTKSNIEVILQHTGKTTAREREVLLSVENIDDIVEKGLIDQLLTDLIQPHSDRSTREG
ncbi:MULTISPECIES: glycosyltransferase family 2 protein [Paenibacillus]|uniref:glycosyltransferase family 2 protein n=1 Tax=Paenibacillus TaxID=44249 RepID=UPI000FB3B196|nr:MULTISPECIES: glycosyltransferase family 2 protein [Paenibacillus]RPK18280.1 Cellulose synthase catalytic subunit [Paenibacillus xylanexedens]